MSTEVARKLRRQALPPEGVMWRLLASFRRRGYHFRRQVHIGEYYADFACREPAIVIEVDGTSHGSDLVQSNDAVRDHYFRGRGYRVLRFWNWDVLKGPEGVVAAIEEALAEFSPPAAPLTPPTRAAGQAS